MPAGTAIDPTTGDVLVALFSGQIGDYSASVLSFGLPGRTIRDPTGSAPITGELHRIALDKIL